MLNEWIFDFGFTSLYPQTQKKINLLCIKRYMKLRKIFEKMKNDTSTNWKD